MPASLYDQPTITFKTYATLDGAPLQEPAILLDFDSLPQEARITPSRAINTDVDGWAMPGQPSTFMGAWHACAPGLAINVEAKVSCEFGTLVVESSANGTAVTDSVDPGNVGAGLTGFTFWTSLPWFRVGAAPSSRGLLFVRSQPRAA